MSLKSIKNAHKGNGKEFRLNLKELNRIEENDVYDKELTIINFDVAHNDVGDYCCVVFKEMPECFFYGKSVLTNLCKEIEADEVALDEVLSDGLKVKIGKAKSKNGRYYESVTIID